MQGKKLTKEKVAELLRREHYITIAYNPNSGQSIRYFNNEKFRNDLKEIGFDLSGTNLKGVQFQNADLSNVNMCRADLRNSVLTNNNLGNIDKNKWKGVKVEGAKIEITPSVKYADSGFEVAKDTSTLIRGLEKATRPLEERRKSAKDERKRRIEEFVRLQAALEEKIPYYVSSKAKTSKEKVAAHKNATSWLQQRRKTRITPR